MKIDIKGVIIPNDDAWIYDLFEYDNVSPSKVLSKIESAEPDEQLDVYINSPGGDVASGSEIYSALREYSGDVAIHIVGLAASAASVVAMAGHSDMSPTGQMMIHNASMRARGDYHDMEKAGEILNVVDRSIAAAYADKSGMSEKELLELMDRETWLTADDAVGLGLVDEITRAKDKTGSARFAASYDCGLLPAKVISDYKNRRMELRNRLIDLKDKERE